jgi:hypothetical protein
MMIEYFNTVIAVSAVFRSLRFRDITGCTYLILQRCSFSNRYRRESWDAKEIKKNNKKKEKGDAYMGKKHKKSRKNWELLPGSLFDGIMPGSVVAVAINNERFNTKKKIAMNVQCA